jgi:hypothetical protein
MEELKVGGKITLSQNKKYLIVDIIEENGKKYLFCSTTQGKIEPIVFEYANINGKGNVRLEKDAKILQKIALKISNENKDKPTENQ